MKKIDPVPGCKECVIACSSVFSSLSKEELDRLTYDKNCNLYRKGSTIFHEGNNMHHFYCVFSGVIKLYKTGVDGREQIISFAKSGDIVGYRSILSKESACTTAKAIEDVIVCAIPSDNMFQLIEKNPKFSMDLMKLACKELGKANQFLTDIAQKSVRERLAEVLLKLKEYFSVDTDGFLKISLTREELANMVGTATESIIRLLGEFKTDNLIELDRRRIKIIDEEKLIKISNYY